MKLVTEKAVYQFAVCLAFIAAVSGCSSPKYNYKLLSSRRPHAKTLKEAVSEAKPRAIWLGEKMSARLEESDDVLSVKGVLSYYRVFWLDVTAGHKYTLTLISWCDHHLTQRVVKPAVYVFDSEGSVVTQTPGYLRRKGAGAIKGLEGNGPTPGLVGGWSFTAEKDDRYRLVIAADNSRPGEANDAGYANPTGSMIFKVNKD